MQSLLVKMLIGVIVAIGISPGQKKVHVWLIGDSTCANKQVRAFPETGWGMPFNWFFDSTVQVENRAMNGRSTRTFISENRWKQVLDSLNEGDYVFIQFGHNDEVKEKVDRYTSPTEFASNLRRYVKESRSKKAIPVLLTPVARRTFDSLSGKIRASHPVYSDTVRKVAIEEGVPFIDLDVKSMELYAAAGMENSKLFFNQLKPGEHPNYPAGKIDNTHFNELGARLIAQIVLAEIRNLKLGLAGNIIGTAQTK